MQLIACVRPRRINDPLFAGSVATPPSFVRVLTYKHTFATLPLCCHCKRACMSAAPCGRLPHRSVEVSPPGHVTRGSAALPAPVPASAAPRLPAAARAAAGDARSAQRLQWTVALLLAVVPLALFFSFRGRAGASGAHIVAHPANLSASAASAAFAASVAAAPRAHAATPPLVGGHDFELLRVHTPLLYLTDKLGGLPLVYDAFLPADSPCVFIVGARERDDPAILRPVWSQLEVVIVAVNGSEDAALPPVRAAVAPHANMSSVAVACHERLAAAQHARIHLTYAAPLLVAAALNVTRVTGAHVMRAAGGGGASRVPTAAVALVRIGNSAASSIKLSAWLHHCRALGVGLFYLYLHEDVGALRAPAVLRILGAADVVVHQWHPQQPLPGAEFGFNMPFDVIQLEMFASAQLRYFPFHELFLQLDVDEYAFVSGSRTLIDHMRAACPTTYMLLPNAFTCVPCPFEELGRGACGGIAFDAARSPFDRSKYAVWTNISGRLMTHHFDVRDQGELSPWPACSMEASGSVRLLHLRDFVPWPAVSAPAVPCRLDEGKAWQDKTFFNVQFEPGAEVIRRAFAHAREELPELEQLLVEEARQRANMTGGRSLRARDDFDGSCTDV